MTLQGKVRDGHIPMHSYSLEILGTSPILFTNISDFDDETEDVTLPDRTRRSGGSGLSVEFTGQTMEHHTEEMLYLEAWRLSAREPVSQDYLRSGTLIKKDIYGNIKSSVQLFNLWIKTRSNPEMAIDNVGDPAQIVWTFIADSPIYAAT